MTRRDVVVGGRAFAVADVDLRRAALHLFYCDAAGKRFGHFDAVRDQLTKSNQQLLFATNAGIFNPDFTPCGLHVENGIEIAPLNVRDGSGNFYLKPNGVFVVDDHGARIIDSAAFTAGTNAVLAATQSGPLLLIDGQINPQFAVDSGNRRIRSGVGVAATEHVVFALSREPVTFCEFALLFRDSLKCSQALYLDGEISAFYPAASQTHEYAGILGVTKKE